MEDTKTEWAAIPLMPGFEADLYSGCIRNANNQRILGQYIAQSSVRYYWRVSVGGAIYRVHRLVMSAALGRPLAPNEQVRHLDGDASHNAANNLAVGSAAQNAADKIGHGTNGRKLTNAKVREIRALAPRRSTVHLARQFGVCRSHVRRIVARTAWRGLS